MEGFGSEAGLLGRQSGLWTYDPRKSPDPVQGREFDRKAEQRAERLKQLTEMRRFQMRLEGRFIPVDLEEDQFVVFFLGTMTKIGQDAWLVLLDGGTHLAEYRQGLFLLSRNEFEPRDLGDRLPGSEFGGLAGRLKPIVATPAPAAQNALRVSSPRSIVIACPFTSPGIGNALILSIRLSARHFKSTATCSSLSENSIGESYSSKIGVPRSMPR